MNGRFGQLVYLLIATFGTAAAACPANLRDVQTSHLKGQSLCALYDHYQDVQARLEAKGFKPAHRVGNVMAPRFINLPDWLAKRDRSSDRAWNVYEPAPVTWKAWDLSARVVDRAALANFQSGSIAPLTLEWLTQLQAVAVKDQAARPGQLRATFEFGVNNARAIALTKSQIQGLRSLDFRSSLRANENLVRWFPKLCLEDQPESLRKSYVWSYGNRPLINFDDWLPVEDDVFFTAADGQSKQCGFIVYADPNETAAQLNEWLAFVNQSLPNLGRPGSLAQDAVRFAARAQRWFIAIHPFASGNGRTSRFVMDWILESLGLPAPILAEMNDDMYTTETQWADAIGEGLRRAVRAGESCLIRPDIRGCKVINDSANIITADAESK